ncbi:hypothetical protein CBR_g48893 [Chara braunii]|uniref:BED-type domain-containing protein n=1 Tax=Chara braunii TaxID=69332 RepID=A0A388M3R8_CHABU|nr:hypothetical protein CBR_g48893 [Chara braunii]|eukprot:GBG89186.1 hypothetical protein CBR_g48893 [Chara braunii]
MGRSQRRQDEPAPDHVQDTFRDRSPVYRYLVVSQKVDNKGVMMLRCTFCNKVFQGSQFRATRHFTQTNYCKDVSDEALYEIARRSQQKFENDQMERVASGIPFNAFCNLAWKAYQQVLLERPGSYPRAVLPSHSEIASMQAVETHREELAEELEEVRQLFRITGATLLFDGRKSRDERPIVNFLAAGSRGVVVYTAINREGEPDNAVHVLRRWVTIFHELSFGGPQRVNALCTDSASGETIECASWWSQYGAGAPKLQRCALRVMHMWSCASPAERNWAVHEGIHTKKHNQLAFEKVVQLVEITANVLLPEYRRAGCGFVLPWERDEGMLECQAGLELEPMRTGTRRGMTPEEIARQVALITQDPIGVSAPPAAEAVFGARATSPAPTRRESSMPPPSAPSPAPPSPVTPYEPTIAAEDTEELASSLPQRGLLHRGGAVRQLRLRSPSPGVLQEEGGPSAAAVEGEMAVEGGLADTTIAGVVDQIVVAAAASLLEEMAASVLAEEAPAPRGANAVEGQAGAVGGAAGRAAGGAAGGAAALDGLAAAATGEAGGADAVEGEMPGAVEEEIGAQAEVSRGGGDERLMQQFLTEQYDPVMAGMTPDIDLDSTRRVTEHTARLQPGLGPRGGRMTTAREVAASGCEPQRGRGRGVSADSLEYALMAATRAVHEQTPRKRGVPPRPRPVPAEGGDALGETSGAEGLGMPRGSRREQTVTEASARVVVLRKAGAPVTIEEDDPETDVAVQEEDEEEGEEERERGSDAVVGVVSDTALFRRTNIDLDSTRHVTEHTARLQPGLGPRGGRMTAAREVAASGCEPQRGRGRGVSADSLEYALMAATCAVHEQTPRKRGVPPRPRPVPVQGGDALGETSGAEGLGMPRGSRRE